MSRSHNYMLLKHWGQSRMEGAEMSGSLGAEPRIRRASVVVLVPSF